MLIPPQEFSSNSPRGFFVVEGVNGAGKSTLIGHIRDWFQAKNRPACFTREPGGTEVGRALRKIILESHHELLHARTETFLFAADRSQHVEELIRPSLEEGQIVVSDRYFYSTIAFQGFGRGQDARFIEAVNEMAVNEMLPDFVLLLDCDPALGLERNRASNTGEVDAFEDEELNFHTKIRDGFLTLARERKEVFVLLDASRSASEVWKETELVLERYLGSLKG